MRIKERRNYYRQDTDLAASFKKEGTDNFIPARIVNISIAGACLKSEKSLRSGKRIELCFKLPGRSTKTISCLAEVIWSGEFEGYHGGIRFVNIERIDKYRIAGFISSSLRRMGLENSRTAKEKDEKRGKDTCS